MGWRKGECALLCQKRRMGDDMEWYSRGGGGGVDGMPLRAEEEEEEEVRGRACPNVGAFRLTEYVPRSRSTR